MLIGTIEGLSTNVSFHQGKFEFILFINNRLVDCNSIKKAVDRVYSNYLPRNTHPFTYLSITLEPSHVDVNVHPTKQEVSFLYEDEVIIILIILIALIALITLICVLVMAGGRDGGNHVNRHSLRYY